jgi:hypothetical protein
LPRFLLRCPPILPAGKGLRRAGFAVGVDMYKLFFGFEWWSWYGCDDPDGNIDLSWSVIDVPEEKWREAVLKPKAPRVS